MWRECIERFLWVVASIKNFIHRAKKENHIEHNNENYHGTLKSNQVKRTPQEYVNEFIIQKLNALLVVDFRLISAFLHV